jgi:hypothetical protein
VNETEILSGGFAADGISRLRRVIIDSKDESENACDLICANGEFDLNESD